jgi:hypothetical protein
LFSVERKRRRRRNEGGREGGVLLVLALMLLTNPSTEINNINMSDLPIKLTREYLLNFFIL